jgi:hypothetical protein
LILGKQKQNFISGVEELHFLSESFEDFCDRRQCNLRRLVWLLQEIWRVKGIKGGSAVLVAMEKGAPLQIFASNKGHGALPKEVVWDFWEAAS